MSVVITYVVPESTTVIGSIANAAHVIGITRLR